MNGFKVKLISLYNDFFYSITKFPYGLGILTSYLRTHNVDVVLEDLFIKIKHNNKRFWFPLNKRIDLNILRYEKKIIDYVCGYSHDKKIEQFAIQIIHLASCEGYDLIGISVMTYLQFLQALLLSKKIKSISNAKVVLGGSFITIYDRKFFTQFPFIDYMIVGDGQVPLLKLIENLQGQIPIEEVPNLIYRDKGIIKANPKRHFSIEDLSIPDFSDLHLDSYRLEWQDMSLPLPYQISRGCTYKCSFCSHGLINPSLEFKSYNKIVRELKTMKERYQSNFFTFHDEAINCSYEYLDKLCDIFIEEKLDVRWGSDARPDNLDTKILHKMKKAGCTFLTFGIESGSNRILENMGKGFTIEQASKVLRDLHQEGIKNEVFLIVGYPHEEEEGLCKTIEFIRKNSEYIDRFRSVSPSQVEYGTPLYNNPERFGIENLRSIPEDPTMKDRKWFAFDEINGLKWKEKVKQQKYFLKKVLKADFKYVFSKKYHTSFIPFWLYFWLKERAHILYRGWFFQVFMRFFFKFVKKI